LIYKKKLTVKMVQFIKKLFGFGKKSDTVQTHVEEVVVEKAPTTQTVEVVEDAPEVKKKTRRSTPKKEGAPKAKSSKKASTPKDSETKTQAKPKTRKTKSDK
jgi:hypothetical protein